MSVRRAHRSRIGRLFAQVLVVGVVLVSLPSDVEAYVPSGPLDVTKTAFGELTSHTGSDPQPYAFTGEPLDLNSGFQYHRARWMDPRTGRFAGMDPFAGVPRRPVTLHRYLYAGGNSVNMIDPTGRFLSSAELSTLGASLTTLAAIALPRVNAILATFSVNLIRIQKGIQYVDNTLTFLEAGLSAIDIMGRMATALSNTPFDYTPGNNRGFEVGRNARQNLGDKFPRIDHFEDGVAVQIKTTVDVANRGKLINLIDREAGNLSVVEGQVRGLTASGQRISVDMDTVRKRGLLVVIPDEPLRWNPIGFFGQIKEISQRHGISVRLTTVRRLRGR